MSQTATDRTAPAKHPTKVERRSDRELVVSRTFDGPPRLVFKAWTRPELLMRWWAPKSTGFSLLSCETDVRPGGSYRFAFGRDGTETMVFFGKYLEVVPNARLVWTNEESGDGAVSTLTFEERAGGTLLVLHELYPSKEALDLSIEGMEGGMPEQFDQLDALLLTLGR
ncbi:MAG: SRPBCC family protein [Amaricoccus sp.]